MERNAAVLISEVQALLQRLQKEERASGFKSELTAASQGLQDAQIAFSRPTSKALSKMPGAARTSCCPSVDDLSLPASVGQAQFISIQGEVEFRRGDSGEWEEGRSRVALHPGDYVRTAEKGSAEIMFRDGTLYTVRPNTLFMVSAGQSSSDAAGGAGEQAI